ncbi:hypothetical protein SEVIR_9G582500v4 [Setaria viridis]
MAIGGGGFAEGPAGAGYSGRVTSFVVLSCIVAGSGGILFGYDLGISGGVTSMESFLSKFFPDVYHQMRGDKKVSNYCRFDSELLTVFTSSLYVAGLVATLFASSVTRRFGRRASILIGGSVFIAGSVFGGAAVNVYMLLLNRILLGIGLGFTNQSIPLYLSEMAPPQYRGAISNGFELCISIGILIANLINYGVEKIADGWGWRISLSLAAVPAAFLTIGAIFLPETPSFIIQRDGNIDEAKILLQRLRGTTRIQKELDDLVSASNISRTIRHPLRNIFKRKYRPQLVIALLIPFFNQVTGINVINFYAPVMFRTIGLKESASLMSAVVTRICATVANIVAMVVVDRLCMVMGTSDLLGPNRDLPTGDQVSRAEYCHCCNLLGDICDWPDLPRNVMSSQVWDILSLWRMGVRDDSLRILLPARDKTAANGANGAGLEEALVLEKDCRGGRGRERGRKHSFVHHIVTFLLGSNLFGETCRNGTPF